jgi:GntR family transcriptional repressor for pyruvate dehydrogenase complex
MVAGELLKVERVSASDNVREQIVALIEGGRLKPGDKLPAEKDLSASFGVSRPVVREALGSLRAMGLVIPKNGRGSFVASGKDRRPPLLGRFSVEALHEVRSHLEVPGAALAAARASDKHVARLGKLIDQLETCTEPERWVTLDAAFHVALAEATENQVQVRLVEHLRDLLVDQSLQIVSSRDRIPDANREHREIFEAVAAGNESAAQAAMSVHLMNVFNI